MMRIFVDTNIYLDWLLRKQKNKGSDDFLKLCEQNKVVSYVSTLSLSTITYYLQKEFSHSESKEILKSVLQFTKVINTTEGDIINSINSKFEDIEDGYQFFSAIRESAEIIITRNIKDFKQSSIPVMTPEEFLKKYS